ncbi:cytochrome c-type biogenesis protein CcmH [Aestuariibacter sp. AA17]|uniref:Cytochrome c-type biogenesis protein n=1 Tax=Fluctibacter corallii TaxID=2984329 RepID=A0ABT3A5W3_9ALTE|nr:cytochrome c-type biogenesis protein [Aestuariibacter sp. AA17]MCV2883741.1 cytochrome c-type biogenesis protein CcmH [Aestuariibacter sp. AA17]
MVNIRTLIVAIFVLLSESVMATEDLESFKTAEHERVYRELVAELRCPRCQNQNIADSNALVAKDMRNKTRKMVADGASKQEVIDFMVGRYGEFAHYKPPVKMSTVILWLAPALFIIYFLYRIRRQSTRFTTHGRQNKRNEQWNEQQELELKRRIEELERRGDTK